MFNLIFTVPFSPPSRVRVENQWIQIRISNVFAFGLSKKPREPTSSTHRHTHIHSFNSNNTKSCNQSIASIALTSALSLDWHPYLLLFRVPELIVHTHKIRLNMADGNCLHSQIGRQTFFSMHCTRTRLSMRMRTNAKIDRPVLGLAFAPSPALHFLVAFEL